MTIQIDQLEQIGKAAREFVAAMGEHTIFAM